LPDPLLDLPLQRVAFHTRLQGELGFCGTAVHKRKVIFLAKAPSPSYFHSLLFPSFVSFEKNIWPNI
jgi:hypothetical protein